MENESVGKLFGALIVLMAIIGGCGMFIGRAVQHSPLPPEYVLTQLDNSELVAAGKLAAGLQMTGAVTQPVTVKLAVPVSVTLFPPVEDNRDEAAQVIWRATFALALGLVGCFLVAAVGISLSIR